MTVGFENIGKTSVLDCLFPIRGYAYQCDRDSEDYQKKYIVLQGKYLMTFSDQKSYLDCHQSPAPLEEHELNNREWKVEEFIHGARKNLFGIRLIPDNSTTTQSNIEIFWENSQKREAWLQRLKRICMNEATHGIAIDQPDINDLPNVKKLLENRKGEAKFELSIWDFAGQNDYYNNHHYFLSTRTVFLILYRLDQAEKGLRGLNFWIKSLSAHLDSSKANKEFTIIVVGTHLDVTQVNRKLKTKRGNQVKKILDTHGMESVGFNYFEVSCETLENIPDLEEGILFSMFGHSYMGERVPRSYLLVEKKIHEHRREYKDADEKILAGKKGRRAIPIVEINKIAADTNIPVETVRRALSLLSLWGECCYFPENPDVSNLVIVDPTFLTKSVLAGLFNPANAKFVKQEAGKLKHKHLKQIWSDFSTPDQSFDFWGLAQKLISLMQQFEVCFEIEPSLSDERGTKRDFQERESLVPSLLDEKGKPPEAVLEMKEKKEQPLTPEEKEQLRKIRMEKRVWPRDPPYNQKVEIERSILFNVLPIELVSRLLVKLHHLIQDGLVWKNQVIIKKNDTQAYIRIAVDDNSFCVTLRGNSRPDCENMMDLIVKEVIYFCFPFSLFFFFFFFFSFIHSFLFLFLSFSFPLPFLSFPTPFSFPLLSLSFLSLLFFSSTDLNILIGSKGRKSLSWSFISRSCSFSL